MEKRGISEVISYTLLILIAVILSIIAFAFLKLYVPKNKPECKAGISLMLEDVECIVSADVAKRLFTITLQNTGTFKVDKAYVRIGQPNRKFKYDVGSILLGKNPHPLFIGTEKGLNPGKSLKLNLDIENPSINPIAEGTYILEVQPAHYTKAEDINSLALCPPITETITCVLAT